ncbi:hypothetical protein BJX61DRAFT_548889 [Aspergillus egyptiacus]|nr:hypothetical protein BJX61DRAFT_548889 [Aspergillus egyptiacus]
MRLNRLALTFYTIATTIVPRSSAQSPEGTPYTDPEANITFATWSTPASSGVGPLTFGFTLPDTALKSDATEFIGYIKCTPATGWCGISLGGAMTNSLLLLAYMTPNDNNTKESVQISTRFTTEYALPGLYTGNATILPVSSRVDKEKDSFEIIFRCTDCLHWDQDGVTGIAPTSSGMLDLAYTISAETPVFHKGECGAVDIVKHTGQGTWVAAVDEGSVSREYKEWAELARRGQCTVGE